MKKTKRIALTGILTALAIALSALESLLTPLLPAGAKPGLSNIVTMFTAKTLGAGYALSVAVVKSLFVLITRGTTAFAMSLAGGAASVGVMVLLIKFGKTKIGCIGIGVAGALTHNLMQLIVSYLIMNVNVLYYAPALIVFALVSGSITGILLHVTVRTLEKRTASAGINADEKDRQ